MSWQARFFPEAALDLAAREPGLAARLIGFNSDPVAGGLITTDARGRYWLWKWERSILVARDGEVLTTGTGNSDVWVFVPVFGPWEKARRATAADHLIFALEQLRTRRTAEVA